MMTSKYGDNFAREWDAELKPGELWDAMQRVKTDAEAGVGMLLALAENGSRLAKVYLGDIFWKGKFGISQDSAFGEFWLRRSAYDGSIEGAFGLAWHLLKSGRTDEALAEYRQLADQGYAPALYVLGALHYKGEVVEKNLDSALAYFRLAEAKGHIRAATWACRIALRQRCSVRFWMRNLTRRVKLLPSK